MDALSLFIIVSATTIVWLTVRTYERMTDELRFEVEELRDQLDEYANFNLLLAEENARLRHPATRPRPLALLDGDAS